MIRRLTQAVLVCLGLISTTTANDLSIQGAIDVFRGGTGPDVEVTIAIPVSELSFRQEGGRFVAGYHPEIVLFDDQGNEARRLGGDRVASVASESATQEGMVDDIARFTIGPGEYKAVLQVVADGRLGTKRFDLTVPAFPRGTLALSDVQLVREIDPVSPVANPESFQKLGHTVIPSLGGSVDSDGPVRWYVELYEIGQRPHRVTFDIVDRFGNRVLSDVREFGAYRDVAQLLEGMSLRNIPPGLYTLRVTAVAGDERAEAEQDFELLGTLPRLSGHWTAQRIGHLVTLIEQVGNPAVAERFQQMEPDDQPLFAYGFWREHDPLLAVTYVGPMTGLGRHEVRLPLLRALKQERNAKRRVDKTFGERLPEPDTLAIRTARDRLDAILDVDKEEPFALTGDALLALEAGLLAEGEFFAKRALKPISGLADAKNAIGLSKIGRNDWDTAADWFSAASESDPEWGTPRLNADLARFLSGKGNQAEELDAIRKAVFHDLTHPEAYYIAGRLLERLNRFEESTAAYRRQIDVNPSHARARFDLGRSLYKQGHVDSASAVWRDLMESRPDFRSVTVGPLLDAYIRIGETGKAQSLIADELRSLDDEARERVEDISLVAGPDEMAAYKSLPEEERERYVRAFWQKRDPTPASPGNERLVEHYRRVVYALHNYPSEKRGWDRRGDVYIRYGEPAHISKHDDIRFETDQRVVRVRERLMRVLSSEAREEIIARAGRYRTSTRDREIVGEYGQQVDYQDFESIDFEMNPNRSYFISDQDNTNRYVRGTEEATYRGRMRESPIHGLPLFPIDGGTSWEYWIYPDVANGIEVVFSSLSPKGEMDYPALPVGRKLARFNEKFWDGRRPELVVTRAKSQQPDRYLPTGDVLDFHFTTADFRGPDGRSRLEVYYGVPVRDLSEPADSLLAAEIDHEIFERGIALFDSTWTPIYRNITPMTFAAGDTDVLAGTLAIDEVALRIEAGRYYLGVQVNHPATKRRNGYTQELIVDAYPEGTFGISDIQIAGDVTQDEAAQVKRGLRVLPMPSKTFNPGQPVLIYYEVYGLSRDSFGQTKHRVDYEIRPRKGKLSAVRVLRALGRLLGFEEKAIVTISYERSGTEANEQNYLEIDPGESKEGVYELTVSVTDLVSEQTIEKSTTFLIGE